MLDRDIAKLYSVETRVINQSVKRNIERFPEAYCFQLSDNEFVYWKSQFVMSNSDKMGLRKNPYTFTERGVAMLSTVLKSNAAINISTCVSKTEDYASKSINLKIMYSGMVLTLVFPSENNPVFFIESFRAFSGKYFSQ